jgi:serine/threonine protein kinase
VRGRRLAHFELIEPIGVGGMAAVLRARDTLLDRYVALKILPPEMASDPESVLRFHQEARSAAKLDHENIARVFFCGEDQNLHFIAFEFVAGDNLRTILEQRGRLPVGEALHYMLQITAGLAHAAQRGVVHRDIKPSNIIVTPNGRAKLVDMGLARSLGPQHDNGLTQSGVTLGTFDYISPEQALEPRDADVRSDIYSLGCTFYHMLTGQPIVPEGTAAKKLHHHQHVKPVDPRQLVPDLPHEVVAILDRMVAKQPRDRYQSPEQLLHHLLLAARNLPDNPQAHQGPKASVSEEVLGGLLSVEAALPNPPSGRPFLLAGLATLAVIVLIILLGQSSQTNPGDLGLGWPYLGDKGGNHADKGTHPGPKEGSPTRPVDRGGKRPEDPPTKGGTGKAPSVSYTHTRGAAARDLLEWANAQSGAAKMEILLTGDLNLSAPEKGLRPGEHLVLRATEVVIRATEDAKTRPTILFDYDAGPAGDRPIVALTIDAQKTSIQGIRFFIDAHQAPDTDLRGLLLRGGQSHRVENCEFIQARPGFGNESKRLASLVAEAAGSRPELILRGCSFLGFEKKDDPLEWKLGSGGEDAVVRQGSVRITASNCAFAPHRAVFRLKDGDSASTPVSLSNCSVLVGHRAAVFDLLAGASAALDVRACLFSRFGAAASSISGTDSAVLIRQAESTEAASRLATVSYRGKDNRYHDLDGYWAIGDAWQKAGWSDFQSKVRLKGGKDENPRILVLGPWEKSFEQQLQLLSQQDVVPVFRARKDRQALRLGSTPDQLVGVQKLLGRDCVPTELPAIEDRSDSLEGRVLVVEKGGNDSSNGVYPGLAEAVLAVRPGDTILIRHNGELATDFIRLNKKNQSDLTIRPQRGFRPVLTLSKDTSEDDTALIRVYDGKLHLAGLEFRVRPSNKDFKVQAVVALMGLGDCSIADCVATLDRGGQEAVVLALATLNETGKMKRDMPTARSRDVGPRLRLENCFVRGEGDLFWGRVSRPCKLELNNCLAALKGSLLNLEISADASAPPAAHKVVTSLSHVTTYLSGHLIRLGGGKDIKNLVPLTCSANTCLFMPGPSGRSLVYLDGSDTEDKTVRDKFTWTGGPNGYGNFSALLDQPATGEAMPSAMSVTKWKELPDESSSKFGIKLKAPPAADLPFTQMEPGQFDPGESTDTSDPRWGADLSTLLRPPKG